MEHCCFTMSSFLPQILTFKYIMEQKGQKVDRQWKFDVVSTVAIIIFVAGSPLKIFYSISPPPRKENNFIYAIPIRI